MCLEYIRCLSTKSERATLNNAEIVVRYEHTSNVFHDQALAVFGSLIACINAVSESFL